jgi:hypothetical protein
MFVSCALGRRVSFLSRPQGVFPCSSHVGVIFGGLHRPDPVAIEHDGHTYTESFAVENDRRCLRITEHLWYGVTARPNYNSYYYFAIRQDSDSKKPLARCEISTAHFTQRTNVGIGEKVAVPTVGSSGGTG